MQMDETFKDFLANEKFQAIDESFFNGNTYADYKKRVLKCLARLGIKAMENSHAIESWIRDYFIDKMEAIDCAIAIRDSQFRTESMTVNTALKILKENNCTYTRK